MYSSQRFNQGRRMYNFPCCPFKYLCGRGGLCFVQIPTKLFVSDDSLFATTFFGEELVRKSKTAVDFVFVLDRSRTVHYITSLQRQTVWKTTLEV